MLVQTFQVFFLFSLTSGCVYILNDIKDVEKDKLHPIKKNRPLPSGEISPNVALIFSTILIAITFYLASGLSSLLLIILLMYFCQNIVYSIWLKKVPIVDVIIISVGFVWRAIAGTVVIQVRTSPWLVICTFLFALFLGFSKRKSELSLVDNNETRVSLLYLDHDLLNMFLMISTTSLLVSYMIYTFESEYVYIPSTIPFAFVAVLRYLQLSHLGMVDENPTNLFKDRLTVLNAGIWVLFSILSIYGILEIMLQNLV
jgi:4-hydroxybenzoate polyprenyltransferase